MIGNATPDDIDITACEHVAKIIVDLATSIGFASQPLSIVLVHLALSQQDPLPATIGDRHYLVVRQREHGAERATATVAHA